ncbi:MAG TPA: GTP cyclohydrolase I FolE [Candidatus Dormibacteraeota bacterium]|nr:GTP cyclohydrolase I FolE [Candidatus Dormibacteraeota bacterium]
MDVTALPRVEDDGAQPHETSAGLVRALLAEIGEDPDREGLRRTPQRVADSLRFLTSGYETDLREVINGAVFEESYEEMVVVKDIEVYSLCEHHLLPFFGKAHVAYFPKGRVLGLSKIPRIVDVFARRLQVQERLTVQVADALDECLKPYGVAVVIEAAHLCMMMRGIQKQNSSAVTSAITGVFRTDDKSRAEFLELIGRPG